MNIYLDIDGVLLANDRHAAQFADDFLIFVLEAFPESTYWLTTHCWRGRNQAAAVLTPYLQPKTIGLLPRIKPTIWQEHKTEGIDFKTPFFWYDDDLFPEEAAVLHRYGAENCLRRIDLQRDPGQLMEEIRHLKDFTRR